MYLDVTYFYECRVVVVFVFAVTDGTATSSKIRDTECGEQGFYSGEGTA
jgi:hypothetical protein